MKVFFGSLRQAEAENLMERTWYAIIDTCLAFTMFRDDLSPGFVAAFTIFFLLKGAVVIFSYTFLKVVHFARKCRPG